tara:strand:+ start:465 stop:1280 length:816 start_codon:yes stop_codon:yes gene_type:complete
MTFVYWGLADTGKNHLQQYAKANKKTFVTWRKNCAKKYSFTNDKQIKEYYYIDEIIRKEEDLDYSYVGYKSRSRNYINNKPKLNEWRIYREHDKFTDIKKCLPVDLLYPMHSLKQINPQYSNNIDFRDWGHFTDENVQWLRTCNNIIPYKTNILDSAICKLDKFNEFVKTSYRHDVVKAYKENKNFVWIFLDNMIYFSSHYVENLLREYNIPYTYFSLDQANYKDTFGWDKEVSRNLTHPKRDWHDDENYNRIKEIAEEYIKYNRRGDTRL